MNLIVGARIRRCELTLISHLKFNHLLRCLFNMNDDWGMAFISIGCVCVCLCPEEPSEHEHFQTSSFPSVDNAVLAVKVNVHLPGKFIILTRQWHRNLNASHKLRTKHTQMRKIKMKTCITYHLFAK